MIGASLCQNEQELILQELNRVSSFVWLILQYVASARSGYYPPIRYCPLEFIFEIVSDAGEPVVRPATPVAGTQAEDDENGLYFTTRNTTTCELIQVDNTVNNNIVSHLLKGGRLRMVYPAYHSFSQTFAAGNTEINMNIVKPSTRLSQMFFTFSNSNINNDNAAGNYDKKEVELFLSSYGGYH